ncbi:hypothetical protein AAE478_010532 [Parahypoxylon ruwenzoriense]
MASAVSLPYNQPPPKTRAIPQSPGPNGSRVVKKRPSPRLGDGLGNIVEIANWNVLPSISVPGHESPIGIVDSARDGSPVTDPGTTSPGSTGLPEGFLTPPSSLATFDTFSDLPPKTSSPLLFPYSPLVNFPAKDEPDANYGKPSLAQGLSNAVDSNTQGQSRTLLLAGALDTTDFHPPTQHSPSATVPIGPAPLATPTTPRFTGSPLHTPAVEDIMLQYFGGKLTTTQAKAEARKYGYPELLETPELLRDSFKSSMPQPTRPLPSSIQTPSIKITHESFDLKLARYFGSHTPSGSGPQANVHVFVDMSNIFIGFCDTYRISKGVSLVQRMKAPYFSFKVLAYIMERARVVVKRVLAGSTAAGGAESGRKRWPQYFFEAEKLKYDMNIFSRVQKQFPEHQKPKRRGKTPPQGALKSSPIEVGTTSADESTEDAIPLSYQTRNGEQGVDENIHLNMMNSILDNISNPGTMVLATGDAAQAEFSPGFFKYATRALDFGWRLELVAWKRTVSSAWTNDDFINKYSKQIQVIFLDDFLEELHADFLP